MAWLIECLAVPPTNTVSQVPQTVLCKPLWPNSAAAGLIAWRTTLHHVYGTASTSLADPSVIPEGPSHTRVPAPLELGHEYHLICGT